MCIHCSAPQTGDAVYEGWASTLACQMPKTRVLAMLFAPSRQITLIFPDFCKKHSIYSVVLDAGKNTGIYTVFSTLQRTSFCMCVANTLYFSACCHLQCSGNRCAKIAKKSSKSTFQIQFWGFLRHVPCGRFFSSPKKSRILGRVGGRARQGPTPDSKPLASE